MQQYPSVLTLSEVHVSVSRKSAQDPLVERSGRNWEALSGDVNGVRSVLRSAVLASLWIAIGTYSRPTSSLSPLNSAL